MFKILDWIKSHKALTVLIAAAVFLLPLVCVHIAYKINAASPFFVSTWDSGNLITYIAGFEAFLGSLFLGGVAVYQNTKVLKYNQQRDMDARKPSVYICNTSIQKVSLSEALANHRLFLHESLSSNSHGNVLVLCITLLNASYTYTEISFSSLSIHAKQSGVTPLEIKGLPENTQSNIIIAPPSSEQKIHFAISTSDYISSTYNEIKLCLVLRNAANEEYNILATFYAIGEPMSFRFYQPSYQYVIVG